MALGAYLEIVAHPFQPLPRDWVVLGGAAQNILCILNRLVDDLIDLVQVCALR